MNIIRRILIVLTALLSLLIVSTSIAQSTLEYRIFSVLRTLPRFQAQDMDEDTESRDGRFSILSKSVTKAAAKYRPQGVSERNMQAALITIAYKETRLAKNVNIGRCDLMPKGQRCDSGRAKTYFQLWEIACPAVWAEGIQPGSQEELDIAAECSARLLTSAYNRCFGKNDHGIWAGAFSGYRSVECNWEPEHEHQSPKARAAFMRSIAWKLSNVKPPQDKEPIAPNEKDSDKSI